MQRYFINKENVFGNKVIISDSDYHHITKVMRNKIGDTFELVTDNAVFVMEIDTSIQEREYKNISILKVVDDGYTVTGDSSVDVILTGLNHELADIDRNEIRAVFHFSAEEVVLGKEHEYIVEIELPDDVGASVQSVLTTVKLTINKAS